MRLALFSASSLHKDALCWGEGLGWAPGTRDHQPPRTAQALSGESLAPEPWACRTPWLKPFPPSPHPCQSSRARGSEAELGSHIPPQASPRYKPGQLQPGTPTLCLSRPRPG